MCCCRKHISHDETMKFKLKVNKFYQNENKTNLLDCTLFNQREEGIIIENNDKEFKSLHIPVHIDKTYIFGRHLEIY